MFSRRIFSQWMPPTPKAHSPTKVTIIPQLAVCRYLITRDGTHKSNVSAPPILNAKLPSARPRAVIENVSRQQRLVRQVPMLQQPMLILFCISFVHPILSVLGSRKTLASLLRCIILVEVASGFGLGFVIISFSSSPFPKPPESVPPVIFMFLSLA